MYHFYLLFSMYLFLHAANASMAQNIDGFGPNFQSLNLRIGYLDTNTSMTEGHTSGFEIETTGELQFETSEIGLFGFELGIMYSRFGMPSENENLWASYIRFPLRLIYAPLPKKLPVYFFYGGGIRALSHNNFNRGLFESTVLQLTEDYGFEFRFLNFSSVQIIPGFMFEKFQVNDERFGVASSRFFYLKLAYLPYN